MAAFLRAFLSFLFATVAAYAFSFAIDILVGVWVGVYSTAGYLPVVTWSVISGVAIFLSSKITPNWRWLALPYVGFGLLAGFGGLVGHRYDFIVAGAMLLHAFLVWRAFSRTTTTPRRNQLQELKTRLNKLTWNSDISERLLLKARRRYPHKTELEICSHVIEQYEKDQERKRLEAKEQSLAREPYEKAYMDSPKGSSSEASTSESAAPEEPTAVERKSSMLAGLNQDEMILLTMIKNRLDNPAQLAALQSMAKDKGVNYDKLLQLARAMNDAVPPLPYDRGRTQGQVGTKDRY